MLLFGAVWCGKNVVKVYSYSCALVLFPSLWVGVSDVGEISFANFLKAVIVH
jgi:hypothetical protein